MATKTETLHTAGFIVSEANGNRSRSQIEILAAEIPAGGLAAGTVMGLMNAGDGTSGVYDDTDPLTASGILVVGVDASASNVAATIIERDAEVNEDELTGIDAAGKIELATTGIIFR